MTICRVGSYLMLGVLLGSTAAWAQSQTGRIDGIVVDAHGNPLGRVTVTGTSPTQIGGRRTTQTNDLGEYHLIGLIPGLFRLRFEAPGLGEVVREDVRVSLAQATELDIVMEARAAAETQVIVAKRPVVDAREAAVGQNYDAAFLKNIPLQSRTYQSVAGLAPGVSGVGPNATSGGNPNILGGASFANSYSVDGMDTTDPTTHTFGTNFNFDAISEVQVLTAARGAEYSMTPGGAINVVTKSGSNQLQLDSSLYYSADPLTIKESGEDQSQFSDFQANLNLGGPVVRDRLWYFASVMLTDRQTTPPPDSTGVLPPHPARHFRGVDYLLKLTWQPATRHNFTFQTTGSPAAIDNLRNLVLVEPEAELHQDQMTQIYTATWQYLPRDDLFFKVGANYQRISLSQRPQSCDFDPAGCLGIPSVQDTATDVTSKNAGRLLDNVRNTWRLSLDMNYLPKTKLGGLHELRAGLRLAYANNPSTLSIPGGMELFSENGAPSKRRLYCLDYDPARGVDYDPTNLLASRCIPGALSLTTSGITGQLFVQDTWSPTRHLHITPGISIDYSQTLNYRDETIFRFLTWTPHVNLTWDPTRDGKTVIRAGFNQYIDPGYLQIAEFVGRSHTTRTCTYDKDTMTYTQGCENSGGLGGRTVGRPDGLDANGNFVRPDRLVDLNPPRTTEILVGADREIMDQLALGFDFIYRQYDHQFEDIETNKIWDPKGNVLNTNGPQYKNGRPQEVFDLETPDEATRRYYGATLHAQKIYGRMQLVGSWTIAKSEGTENSSFATTFLDNPTQNHFYYGPLNDDYRHAIKAQLSYDVTENFLIGSTFQYTTGAPYSKKFFNDNLADFTDFRAPRGTIPIDPNDPSTWREGRLPDFAQLDLHASYSLRRLLHQNLQIVLDIFNVLARRTPILLQENNVLSGPIRFGDPLDRQRPFQVRLGIRYVY